MKVGDLVHFQHKYNAASKGFVVVLKRPSRSEIFWTGVDPETGARGIYLPEELTPLSKDERVFVFVRKV